VSEDLREIANEIRGVISNYQKENCLSFVEDTHTYFIKGADGNITSDMLSVSSVLKVFYHYFDSSTTRSFQMLEGDPEKEKMLLTEWAEKGSYSTNLGSKVHFVLEQELINQYGGYKEVRKPIFECDEEQNKTADAMIKAGLDFIDLMHERGAVLLDTEIIMGSIGLGYFGQPDKTWLMRNKHGEIGIVVSDWKSNQPKNFEVQSWTKLMMPPFQHLYDTALSHYYVQIPLYAKLLIKMLEGTKFENIKFFGGVVVLVRKEGEFEEYRIPQDVVNTVMNMNVKEVLREGNDRIKQHKYLEQRDASIRNR
jgi:hypothetical protein